MMGIYSLGTGGHPGRGVGVGGPHSRQDNGPRRGDDVHQCLHDGDGATADPSHRNQGHVHQDCHPRGHSQLAQVVCQAFARAVPCMALPHPVPLPCPQRLRQGALRFHDTKNPVTLYVTGSSPTSSGQGREAVDRDGSRSGRDVHEDEAPSRCRRKGELFGLPGHSSLVSLLQ